MREDRIQAVGIDDRGSLRVKPATATFPYIYREAMEVHWDADRKCLFTPTPRQWSYLEWFQQIMNAARETGVDLKLVPATSWFNIDTNLRNEFAALCSTSDN